MCQWAGDREEESLLSLPSSQFPSFWFCKWKPLYLHDSSVVDTRDSCCRRLNWIECKNIRLTCHVPTFPLLPCPPSWDMQTHYPEKQNFCPMSDRPSWLVSCQRVTGGTTEEPSWHGPRQLGPSHVPTLFRRNWNNVDPTQNVSIKILATCSCELRFPSPPFFRFFHFRSLVWMFWKWAFPCLNEKCLPADSWIRHPPVVTVSEAGGRGLLEAKN